MFELAWPWLLLLLPLPWLLPRPRAAGAGAVLRMPGLRERIPLETSAERGRARPSPLFALLWLLLCLAVARPHWLDAPMAPPHSGRDLLLALDLSGSMSEQDMTLGGRDIDRLGAAKAVLVDFLERRRGDRIGLIVFGRQAYSLVPLTQDLDTVRRQLLDSRAGMAGRETAIGDAIALAVKRLRERPEAQRVLILLTDGVNTAGVVSPDRALTLAVEEGVRIHSIGFGGDAPRRGGLFPSAPEDEIDEALLTRLAESTGGRYFRARNTSELAGIYAEIDAIEPVERDAIPTRPRRELYPWPLGAALLVWLLWTVVANLHGVAPASPRSRTS